MSRRKIKERKANQHQAKFRPLNVPVELWPNFIDFLWGGVMNVNPKTVNPKCITFVREVVYEAIGN